MASEEPDRDPLYGGDEAPGGEEVRGGEEAHGGEELRGGEELLGGEKGPGGEEGPGAEEVDGGEEVRPGVDWDELLAQLARQPEEDGWLTLDEASGAAGVSRSTLRSWYRSGQIPSKMVAGVHGPQRLVPLDAVIDRALRSARARRQLEHARSLEAEVAELRQRVETLERHLGII